ncbi:adenine phosphoribosyltransferase [Chironomus tepperi]|uniref:adenine phosphoribosyltransferase n=1 Tax=Chironomus tepperi TaxID=113505 RepID=UPI00391F55BA
MTFDTADQERLDLLKSKIGEYPNFPRDGILFKDIFTAFRDGKVCVATKHLMLNYIRKNHPSIDAVVGLDARGFLFSFMIASELEIGCVPVRKKGKLPGETTKVEYVLEYGTDVFEIQTDSIKAGQKVIIVDDLLATGGSLKAAIELVRKAGGVVQECIVVLELEGLKGRKNLDVPVFSFLQYDEV